MNAIKECIFVLEKRRAEIGQALSTLYKLVAADEMEREVPVKIAEIQMVAESSPSPRSSSPVEGEEAAPPVAPEPPVIPRAAEPVQERPLVPIDFTPLSARGLLFFEQIPETFGCCFLDQRLGSAQKGAQFIAAWKRVGLIERNGERGSYRRKPRHNVDLSAPRPELPKNVQGLEAKIDGTTDRGARSGTPEGGCAPRAAEVPLVKERFDTTEGNSHLKPDSPEAIELGRTRLHDPFSRSSLVGLLDGGDAQAGTFLAHWTMHKWIENSGFMQWRKTEKFGHKS